MDARLVSLSEGMSESTGCIGAMKQMVPSAQETTV